MTRKELHVAYTFPPPCNMTMDFIDKVFPSYVSPMDRWVYTERGSKNIPEWMWEILTTDNENKNSTQSP